MGWEEALPGPGCGCEQSVGYFQAAGDGLARWVGRCWVSPWVSRVVGVRNLAWGHRTVGWEPQVLETSSASSLEGGGVGHGVAWEDLLSSWPVPTALPSPSPMQLSLPQGQEPRAQLAVTCQEAAEGGASLSRAR